MLFDRSCLERLQLDDVESERTTLWAVSRETWKSRVGRLRHAACRWAMAAALMSRQNRNNA